MRKILGATLISLALGCSGGGGGSNPSPAQKPLPGAEKATALKLAQFNWVLDQNALTVPLGQVDKDGTAHPGNVTSFDISYKFNSADNTVFEMLADGESGDPNCNERLKDIALVSADRTQSITPSQRMTIAQNTDYLVTFKFAVEKDCAILSTAAIAWIGKETEAPMTGLKCNQQAGQPYILASNGKDFYASEMNSKSGVFVSTNPPMFCGFPLPPSTKAACTPTRAQSMLGWNKVDCSAQLDSDTYSFTIAYDQQNSAAKFSCAKNADDMGTVETRLCKEVLLNSKALFQ